VLELRQELEARSLSPKGLKSQLIARLTKILRVEQEKEEKGSQEVKVDLSSRALHKQIQCLTLYLDHSTLQVLLCYHNKLCKRAI